ncbi:MAG TPA: rubredoxin [Chitinophagaceae bacterium]|nr:rubredoxin [Chitinophagaceae bacterium]
MKTSSLIKINFRGGIISPGDLLQVLIAAEKAHIAKISFGTRQQLLADVAEAYCDLFTSLLQVLQVNYEKDADERPNVVSSYPAEEVFITKTWLSEGVYKDIFDGMDYEPRLKINISDSNQSFTPILTGNINWVASLHSPHFWHVFIRFPKTNIVYEWNQLVYTNDVARMSKHIEAFILDDKSSFYDNPQANGDALFEKVQLRNYITKPAGAPADLPAFNLPYYEGLNRYNDKYWLGIYRRDELFDIAFLKDICLLCLESRIGQLCSTSWKTIMVKGIEEKNRPQWNALLARHRVNVRHAANELNFQVEDHCKEGLELKNYLVRQLSSDDMRTFGICIGIKTRKKSEVFSSILVRRRHLVTIAGRGFLPVYDLLCANDFNPNERTGFIFSRATPKLLLPEQLRRAILLFYRHQVKRNEKMVLHPREEAEAKQAVEWVHQCPHCYSIYDPAAPVSDTDGRTGITFEQLPHDYACPLCEAPKQEFRRIEQPAHAARP